MLNWLCLHLEDIPLGRAVSSFKKKIREKNKTFLLILIACIALLLKWRLQEISTLISSNIETALTILPFILLLVLILYLFNWDVQVIGSIVTIAIAFLFFIFEKNLTDKTATDTLYMLHSYNCAIAVSTLTPVPGFSYHYFIPELYTQNISYIYETVGEEHTMVVLQAVYDMTYANDLTRLIAATNNLNIVDPVLIAQAELVAENYSNQRRSLSVKVNEFCRKEILPAL